MDDIVTEVIEVKLLGALSTLFNPITAFEMAKDQVTQIAGESEESQNLREQLNKKLWVLTKGSDTCRRFMGIRGLGKDGTHLGSLLALNRSLESKDTVDATLQPDRSARSYRSDSSFERSEEAAAIDSESDEEHPRPCSVETPDQNAKSELDPEPHATELEPLSTAQVRAMSIKRKKKGKAAPRLETPIESDF